MARETCPTGHERDALQQRHGKLWFRPDGTILNRDGAAWSTLYKPAETRRVLAAMRKESHHASA